MSSLTCISGIISISQGYGLGESWFWAMSYSWWITVSPRRAHRRTTLTLELPSFHTSQVAISALLAFTVPFTSLCVVVVALCGSRDLLLTAPCPSFLSARRTATCRKASRPPFFSQSCLSSPVSSAAPDLLQIRTSSFLNGSESRPKGAAIGAVLAEHFVLIDSAYSMHMWLCCASLLWSSRRSGVADTKKTLSLRCPRRRNSRRPDDPRPLPSATHLSSHSAEYNLRHVCAL